MTGQRYLEFSRGKIPKLNGTICRSRCKVSVAGRDSEAPDPAMMTNDDSVQLEGTMPFWLNQFTKRCGANSTQSSSFTQVHIEFPTQDQRSFVGCFNFIPKIFFELKQTSDFACGSLLFLFLQNLTDNIVSNPNLSCFCLFCLNVFLFERLMEMLSSVRELAMYLGGEKLCGFFLGRQLRSELSLKKVPCLADIVGNY